MIYQYYGIDRRTGAKVRGVIDGYDYCAAVLNVQESAVTPIKLTPLAAGGIITDFLVGHFPDVEIPPWLAKCDIRQQLSERFIIDFFSQLATLVNARITTAEALRLLAGEAPLLKLPSHEQRFITRLHGALQGGSNLAPALQKENVPVPSVVIALIAAGEKSGTLKTVFGEVVDLLETARRTRENLANVLAYPAIVLAAVLVTVVLLAFFVIPAFAEMLGEIGGELPFITQLVFDSARFVVENFWLLPIAAVLGVSLWQYCRHQPRARLAIDRQILRLPIIGRLLTLVYTAETTAALRSLLSGGIPLYEALSDVKSVPDNRYLAWQLERAASAVRAGHDLAAGLGSDSAFSHILPRLAAVAYNTGDLAGAMDKASMICRDEAKRLMERIKTLIEPILLLIVGTLVGVTVLALVQPLLDSLAIAG